MLSKLLGQVLDHCPDSGQVTKANPAAPAVLFSLDDHENDHGRGMTDTSGRNQTFQSRRSVRFREHMLFAKRVKRVQLPFFSQVRNFSGITNIRIRHFAFHPWNGKELQFL